jgi:hypothetical protein
MQESKYQRIRNSFRVGSSVSAITEIWDLHRRFVRMARPFGTTLHYQLNPVGLRFEGRPLVGPGRSCIAVNRSAWALGG